MAAMAAAAWCGEEDGPDPAAPTWSQPHPASLPWAPEPPLALLLSGERRGGLKSCTAGRSAGPRNRRVRRPRGQRFRGEMAGALGLPRRRVLPLMGTLPRDGPSVPWPLSLSCPMVLAQPAALSGYAAPAEGPSGSGHRLRAPASPGPPVSTSPGSSRPSLPPSRGLTVPPGLCRPRLADTHAGPGSGG